MTSIDPEALVGDLVAVRQSRSAVLERNRIDYCCGGQKSLKQACAERGVAVAEIVRELAAADGAPPAGPGDERADWAGATAAELIGHIVDVHHVALRRDLPRLVTLANKVEKAHGEKHAELRDLARVMRALWVELEQHMLKEENILFPAILELERRGLTDVCGGNVEHPLTVMEAEHVDAGLALEEMRRLSNDYTPASDACNSWRALTSGLAAFTLEIHRHIHEENNILHPRARALAARAASTFCGSLRAQR